MLRRKFNQLAFRQNIMMANLKKFAQCLLGNKSDISGMKRDEFHSNIVQGFFYYMHELKWIFRLIFFLLFLFVTFLLNSSSNVECALPPILKLDKKYSSENKNVFTIYPNVKTKIFLLFANYLYVLFFCVTVELRFVELLCTHVA
jgi:hypothetical protein